MNLFDQMISHITQMLILYHHAQGHATGFRSGALSPPPLR